MEGPRQQEAKVTKSALILLGVVLFVSFTLLRMATLGYSLSMGSGFVLLFFLLEFGLLAVLALGMVVSAAAFLLQSPRTVLMVLATLVCVVTLASFVFVPFGRIAMDDNFRSLRSEREAIVSRVLDGKVANTATGTGSHYAWIGLGPDEPRVSNGGNEIIVGRVDGETYVFFYTDRNIFGEFEGFLWVSPGGDPLRFRDVGKPGGGVIRQYNEHWYLVYGG